MIDPIIFSFKIGAITLALRWYGILIMTAVLFSAWFTARRVKQRGGNPETVWDGLIIVMVAGILGARLWYVINATLGGSRYYLDNPLKILAITEGGLHIFGAFVLGGLALLWYTRRRGLDTWLILDAAAPAMLIGQALARPANFINQELYGPPTTLPWGIPISPDHRLAPWSDLALYPESTRFHPTFAYEMVWNLLAAGLLLWIDHRFGKKLKPGTLFIGWLILAGTGRFLIEAFRPDQPRLPGLNLSYSRLISALMAIFGIVWMLARYGKLRLPGLSNMPDQYKI